MPQPDENGFVKRGFFLLAGMSLLAATVLTIVFYRPEQQRPTVELKDLPSNASEPGWKIRYNAAAALLRRGSDDAPWGVVVEMLDEKQQLKNCEVKRSDGSIVPDQAMARNFVLAGLKALKEWPKKAAEAGHNDAAVPPDVVAKVDSLLDNPDRELAAFAKKTKQAIEK